jgi:hypothetical protein
MSALSGELLTDFRSMTLEVKVTSRLASAVKDLFLDVFRKLTRTLVAGREKSSWRSDWRCWNRIPNVEVLVIGVEIVDLELFLITLTSSTDAGGEALEELHAAHSARRRRFELAHRLLRLRHHLSVMALVS